MIKTKRLAYPLIAAVPLITLIPISSWSATNKALSHEAAKVAPSIASRHKLSVQDIEGYYVTDDNRATYTTLKICFIGKYQNAGFEQGNLSGEYGSNTIVGQGVISGDEGDTDNFVRFDFMYLEPQDETMLVHCRSIMRGNAVTGMLIGYGESGAQIHFRRVSHADYAAKKNSSG